MSMKSFWEQELVGLVFIWSLGAAVRSCWNGPETVVAAECRTTAYGQFIGKCFGLRASTEHNYGVRDLMYKARIKQSTFMLSLGSGIQQKSSRKREFRT
jgi:hypothetical protein